MKANLTTFENLQNEAHEKMGISSEMGVFNGDSIIENAKSIELNEIKAGLKQKHILGLVMAGDGFAITYMDENAEKDEDKTRTINRTFKSARAVKDALQGKGFGGESVLDEALKPYDFSKFQYSGGDT